MERVCVRRTVRASAILSFFVFLAPLLYGQGLTGTLTGTTTDPSGAAVVGAKVTAVDDATHAEYDTQSGADGHFTIANLSPGTYTVTVAMPGFRKSVYKDVKIIVGQTYDLTARLEIGEVTNTVMVEAGQEVVETTNATVGASITGRSITELPFTSRSTLDLATLMAGAATTGVARQTSFNGLPKGAINITYDGINVQDNLLKSSDGFFTIIRATTDAVEEFSISTAANGAQDASQGAVQIKFETKRGGNAFHGGVWEYFRNDVLNSNYYFNNEARPQVPRQVQRLNQYGWKIGGPILKDKLFFFADMDNYISPLSRSFTRAILTPDAVNGLFTYGTNGVPIIPPANTWTTCVASSPRNNGGAACTVDLAKFAAVPANGVTFVKDPAISTILANVQAARGNSSISTGTPANPWLDNATFNAPGKGSRRFPDVRFDWNITKNHQFTAIYHYAHFSSSPDFLNNANPFLPIDPFTKLLGSQVSNRNQYALAWRWNIGSNKSNELRFGLQSSLVAFFPDENPALYPVAKTNLGNINVRPVLPGALFPTFAFANFQPFLAYNAQGRNTPLGTLLDNFSWTKGNHSLSFGFEVTEIRFHGFLNGGRLVQTANIGLSSSDPAIDNFTASKFPGINSNSNAALQQLYGTLTGRLASYSGAVSVDPAKKQYVPGSPNLQAGKQRQFGFYGTDSWRVWPNLTFTYGLRWDYQGAPYDTLNESFSLVNGFADVFGVSGQNNLFKPGTLTGAIPKFQLNGSRPWYNADYTNFAPSVGLAWQPNFTPSILQKIFPGSGKTVFRAGYSISYTREGFNNFNSIAFGNPGIDGSIFANPVRTIGCNPSPALSAGNYPGGCITLTDLQNGKLQALNTKPASFPASGTFEIQAFSGQSVNSFDPNLRTPRVQSWSAGIQRQLGQDTVLEIRYVGNHATGLWRQDNINEVNIFENGFLTDFLNAQHNLAATGGASFGNTSPCAGSVQPNCTVPVPILTAAFTGSKTGSQTNPNFRSSQFITPLNDGVAGSFATTLAFNQTFLCNLAGQAALPGVACGATNAGLPVNIFVADPHATGGAFRYFNGSQSTYNALQVEMRRRFSRGLQLSGNYTYSKSLTNYFGDSSVGFSNFTTLRNPGNDKGPSPWDLRHNFKLNGIYELPFGPGHHWSAGNGLVNRAIGGWQISTIHRWQSGRVFLLQSGRGGTVNQNDPGVVLNGITRNQLQSMLGVRKMPNNQVFYFPASLISTSGAANPAFVAPCATPGQLCSRVFLTGPTFYRADISLSKKTNITERVNFELRAEMLNAFNNINFFYPGAPNTSVPTASVTANTFGRITSAFQDPNGTDDNGGRIVQLVFRINF